MSRHEPSAAGRRRALWSAVLVGAGPAILVSPPAIAVCGLPPDDRPVVGLALGGGGARGYAHIGVLQALEELHVPVDVVAGTSIGSIAGGLLAAGLDAEAIARFASDIDWVALFNDDTPRGDRPFRRKQDDDLALVGTRLGVGPEGTLLPAGAISGQNLLVRFESAINEQVQVRDFDALPIPFRAVAADLATGREVVLGQGSLALALRASMAVPTIFDPVSVDGRKLVDGGIANNLPVSVVRALGAEVVIAVDVGSGLLAPEQISDVLTVAEQLTNILVENTTAHQRTLLAPDDVLIEPPLGDAVGAADFDKVAIGRRIGYEAAMAARSRLAPLALAEEAWDRYRAALGACVPGRPRIQWVALDNQSRFRDSVILERLNVPLDAPLDVAAIEGSLKEIYALGFIRLARYEVRERDGEPGVVVQVVEDPRGHELLEFGLDVFGDDSAADFNLRVGLLKTDLDDAGAELRALAQIGADEGLLLEYYKPFTDSLRYVLEPQLLYERRTIGVFDADGDKLEERNVTRQVAQLSLGREFGRHAALYLRARTLTGRVGVAVGDPSVPDRSFAGGEWIVSALYDRLDDPNFPARGLLANLDYILAAPGMGAEDDYAQAILEFVKPWSFGRHTLVAGGTYQTTLEGDAPPFGLFRTGGFLRLSGLEENELAGEHVAVLAGTYRYTLNRGGFFPAYLGASLEVGGAVDDADRLAEEALLHASVYLGFDSPIGPVYTGVGFGEDDRRKLFLRIGNVFRRSTIGR